MPQETVKLLMCSAVSTGTGSYSLGRKEHGRGLTSGMKDLLPVTHFRRHVATSGLGSTGAQGVGVGGAC